MNNLCSILTWWVSFYRTNLQFYSIESEYAFFLKHVSELCIIIVLKEEDLTKHHTHPKRNLYKSPLHQEKEYDHNLKNAHNSETTR
jgi:hypothetical protein